MRLNPVKVVPDTNVQLSTFGVPFMTTFIEGDGWPVHELLDNTQKSYHFDDIICLPGFVDFPVDDVDLTSRISRNIHLKRPIASSPMDTVTETQMAIAMALSGGIGIIHGKMDAETQIAQVSSVKRFRNGFILHPKCLNADHTVRDVLNIKNTFGYSTIPITENGSAGSKLLGLVTSRDILGHPENARLGDIMVTKLITSGSETTLKNAQEKMQSAKVGALPIVDDQHRLISQVSRTDLKKTQDFPLASMSATDQLMVGASVNCDEDEEPLFERIRGLIEAQCDLLVLESSNNFMGIQLKVLRKIKEFSSIDVVCGNIGSLEQAIELVEAGCDGLRVGIGCSSMSLLSNLAISRPQATTIFKIARFGKQHNVPIIADGGLRNSGHWMKAFALGASTIMCGQLFAGTEESPGEYFYKDSFKLKRFQGNRRNDSNKTRIGGAVVDKGSVHQLMPYYWMGVKHGLQDLGIRSITELHESLANGKLRIELRSSAAQREGQVHDLHKTSRNRDHLAAALNNKW